MLKIGNGTYPVLSNGNEIALPEECTVVYSLNHLIDKVFPDIREKFITDININIINQLPGEALTYLSADTVQDVNAAVIPVEALHNLQPSGVPPHELVLKPYMPVLLMRNINKKVGLCNGTRLMILELHKNHIKVRITSGRFKGDIHFLFRINCIANNSRCPLTLNRFQFPIQPGFSMTINKSQGQTLKVVGIDLMSPVFSHGQLYVALSRACDPGNVFVHRGSIGNLEPIHNVVFQEILNE